MVNEGHPSKSHVFCGKLGREEGEVDFISSSSVESSSRLRLLPSLERDDVEKYPTTRRRKSVTTLPIGTETTNKVNAS